MATLAAADNSAKRPLLITLGSPRVGNSDFVSGIREFITPKRYVNCCDFVTRIPPETFSRAHMENIMAGFLGRNAIAARLESALARAANAISYWSFKRFFPRLRIRFTSRENCVVWESVFISSSSRTSDPDPQIPQHPHHGDSSSGQPQSVRWELSLQMAIRLGE
jgi:hypothetical protein